MIGLVVILATILLSRNVNARAMSLLAPDQRIQFHETFRKRRWLNLAVMIVQIGGYFLALHFLDWSDTTIITYFFFSLIIWMGIQTHLSYNALQKIDMPRRVIQLSLFSSAIRLIGILVYVVLVVER